VERVGNFYKWIIGIVCEVSRFWIFTFLPFAKAEAGGACASRAVAAKHMIDLPERSGPWEAGVIIGNQADRLHFLLPHGINTLISRVLPLSDR